MFSFASYAGREHRAYLEELRHKMRRHFRLLHIKPPHRGAAFVMSEAVVEDGVFRDTARARPPQRRSTAIGPLLPNSSLSEKSDQSVVDADGFEQRS